MKHGKIGTYTNHACRCEACKVVGSASSRARRKKMFGTPPITHGITGYVTHGCRCNVCSLARRKGDDLSSIFLSYGASNDG